MVEGICETFEECRTAVDEILNADEDEFPRRSYILDGNQKEGTDSEVEAMKRGKKRGKTNLFSHLQDRKSQGRAAVRRGIQSNEKRIVHSYLQKS